MTPAAKKKIAAAAVFLIFGGWLAGLSSFARDVAALTPPSALQPLDAIVVLTGGSNRIDTGFNLLEQGLGKKLFISGVSRGVDVRQLLANWKDAPQASLDCCVVLGFEAADTVGNARETAEWLEKEGFHTLYLVTANYHIRRALLEFRRSAPDVEVTAFPVVPEGFDAAGWWKEPATCILLAREYAKYLTKRFRILL